MKTFVSISFTGILIPAVLLVALAGCRNEPLDVRSPQDATGPDLGLSDRYYEVQLLHSDDFNKSLANWTTEIETEASIAIVDGKLDINTMVGSTVWFNQKLSGPIAIAYEVTTLDDGQDGLPRDHNLFWMALNPKAPNVRPSGAGSLGDYNCYDMYYAGIGGNKNRTTRFRRYHNCNRTLIQESSDKAHLNAANQTYHMRIVCLDNQVQVYRDGQIYWDFTDPSPKDGSVSGRHEPICR